MDNEKFDLRKAQEALAEKTYVLTEEEKKKSKFGKLVFEFPQERNEVVAEGDPEDFVVKPEAYFCGAYDFDNDGHYERFAAPYSGMIPYAPDGLYSANQRFSLYRWHVADPIRFREDVRVTIQALGWRSGHRYLPLQDDISSVAFYYLDHPNPALPPLPDRDGLEII